LDLKIKSSKGLRLLTACKWLCILFLIKEGLLAQGIDSCVSTLTVRNGHRLVYDSHRRKVMMFGGADAERVVGDLWEWNGKRWRCLNNTELLARTFPAIAYDTRQNKIVMFGGNRVLFGKGNDEDTILGDTWEWNGRKWREVIGSDPPARAEAMMVYDTKRSRVVLFGGYFRQNKEIIRLGDTWEFDGQKWFQVAEIGPQARSGAAMVYDENKRTTILFGGSDGANDTWEWNGEKWTKIKTNEVGGIFNTSMEYDPLNKKIIRFGGWNGSNRVGDTWQFDGFNWKKLNIVGPEPRNHSAMVYDFARQRIVLFGGHDGDSVFGDTWEWDGKQWQRMTFTLPQKHVQNGH
jgi:hypothetical protein